MSASETVDALLDRIVELKRAEKCRSELWDLIQEVRNNRKHDAPLALQADEDSMDYIYRRLWEIYGEE